MSRGRPGGVTVVAVLTWINGLSQIVTGVLVLMKVKIPGVAGGTSESFGQVMAIVWIALGIVVILVATGLLNGNRLSRILVTLSFLLSIVISVYVLVTTPSQLVSALVPIVLSVIGLMLLWSRRASAFFAA